LEDFLKVRWNWVVCGAFSAKNAFEFLDVLLQELLLMENGNYPLFTERWYKFGNACKLTFRTAECGEKINSNKLFICSTAVNVEVSG